MLGEPKPDFSKAYIKANEMLVKSSIIKTFPFSPRDLIKEQSSIVCRSYDTARKYGIEILDFGSESATIFRFRGKSIIFYDETKPKTHIAFSLLHEFGHVILGHDFVKKDQESYRRYEIETNYFVAQLLMPEQIVRELQRRGKKIDIKFLKKTFGVSSQAAQKRIDTLCKIDSEWHSNEEKEFDDLIILRHANFLNKICPVIDEYDFEYEYDRQLERDSWI